MVGPTKLSVIIPCLNAADTIAMQLSALADQASGYDWEVIVCDNGSTDATLHAVEQFRGRLPHLRIVDASARKGASYARNAGAAAATGDALLFCDADDEVAPGWIDAMGRALSQFEFVAGPLDYVKLNQPWLYAQEPRQYCRDHPYLPYAASANLGIRRSVHDAVGGFDDTVFGSEDTDYCWRVQLAGAKLHSVPDAVVHYRLRPTLSRNYTQAYTWGLCHALLYTRYRPLGMPRRYWYQGVQAWTRLLLRLPELARRETRVKWVRALGWQAGRLQGYFRYRLLTRQSTSVRDARRQPGDTGSRSYIT